MICTVTFNPSLDYIVSVDDFQLGMTNRTSSELILPGGKGINVSIVLKNLGLDSTALGYAAGFTGEELDKLPISVEVNGEWQTFPDAAAADEALNAEPIPEAAGNFHITDDNLGVGGPKQKFARNIEAIQTLRTLEQEHRGATAEEQQVLSQYVGWGGLADVFDPNKENWSAEYTQLKGLLTEEEYAAARASTLNAHYTSPVVIRAIYDAVEKMGFQSGNILEPSMGIGNFFGMLPSGMADSRLYGVELDSITGRIAQKLYPQADITVAGFETTDRRDFYDLAVGNVPFGQYKVNDKAYNKLGFSIHNYFFAKAIDQVRQERPFGPPGRGAGPRALRSSGQRGTECGGRRVSRKLPETGRAARKVLFAGNFDQTREKRRRQDRHRLHGRQGHRAVHRTFR